jgi:DDE superfamily endonuclease
MMYIRYPLSLRQVEDLWFERGIDICHETVRFRWNRFGPMFAAEIRKRRFHHRSYSCWRWHLDEVFVRINGETHYLWRAVDHEGEGCVEVSEAHDEALRPTEGNCHGPTSLIRCRDESHWCREPSAMRSVAQQSSRKFTPAVPATRKSDGKVQGRKDPAEIRRHPCLDPQPFQPGASSKPSRNFQREPLCRPG